MNGPGEVCELYKKQYKMTKDYLEDLFKRGRGPRRGFDIIDFIPKKTPVNMGNPADYGRYGADNLDYGHDRMNTEIDKQTGQ